MTDKLLIKRSPNVVARRVAGETVLVPLNASTSDPNRHKAADLYLLNETGETLWEALSSPRDTDELARNLMASYDVSADRAHSDVLTFVNALLEIGALQHAGE